MSIYDGVDATANLTESPHHRRKFILCFDGTGNKFTGTDSDSNILKIYRMLDRSDHTCITYYQPGIGTYAGSSLSHTSHLARLKSWYMKTKDMAFGSSLDEHVMGGYKFLMRYYRTGDEIYMFGFSRGAYTARFLAEMIDHVGLLSQGNEELCRFAWKTFQKWQCRKNKTEKDREQKKYLQKFMFAFRETFSRPVTPIRFLGLFDTVNSVAMFENAFMSRTKFPYTARTTARVIRHAVSIGERRAKFRQDLVGERRDSGDDHRFRAAVDHLEHLGAKDDKLEVPDIEKPGHSVQVPGIAFEEASPERSRKDMKDERVLNGEKVDDRGRKHNLEVPTKSSTGARNVSTSPGGKSDTGVSDSASFISWQALHGGNNAEQSQQDIQEVWFLGDHADIGGGWSLRDDKDVPAAHIPLVWMVREAQRAGLRFEPNKLRSLQCSAEEHHDKSKDSSIPTMVESAAVVTHDKHTPGLSPAPVRAKAPDGVAKKDLPAFQSKIHRATTESTLHDLLSAKKEKNNGFGARMWWQFMEHLPLRRMDLQSDGSWKPIMWPLPMGEVRDIPDNVVVHNSVIKRMMADKEVRPGNLIVGGGGRGVLIAPEEYGMGEWKILREEGDIVGEVWVRDVKPESAEGEMKTDEKGTNGLSKEASTV